MPSVCVIQFPVPSYGVRLLRFDLPLSIQYISISLQAQMYHFIFMSRLICDRNPKQYHLLQALVPSMEDTVAKGKSQYYYPGPLNDGLCQGKYMKYVNLDLEQLLWVILWLF